MQKNVWLIINTMVANSNQGRLLYTTKYYAQDLIQKHGVKMLKGDIER